MLEQSLPSKLLLFRLPGLSITSKKEGRFASVNDMTAPPLAPRLQAWLDVLEQLSHQEILELPSPWSPLDLQNAFHRFSSSFHPDRHPEATPSEKDQLRRIFQRGAEAYRVLKNPRLRAEYELRLATLPAAQNAEVNQRQGLSALCKTPGARLHARQAEQAIDAGDLERAILFLQKSVRIEFENEALQERLVDLRSWISLGGGSTSQ